MSSCHSPQKSCWLCGVSMPIVVRKLWLFIVTNYSEKYKISEFGLKGSSGVWTRVLSISSQTCCYLSYCTSIFFQFFKKIEYFGELIVCSQKSNFANFFIYKNMSVKNVSWNLGTMQWNVLTLIEAIISFWAECFIFPQLELGHQAEHSLEIYVLGNISTEQQYQVVYLHIIWMLAGIGFWMMGLLGRAWVVVMSNKDLGFMNLTSQPI